MLHNQRTFRADNKEDQHICFTARHYVSAEYAVIVYLSVRPSVGHKSELQQDAVR